MNSGIFLIIGESMLDISTFTFVKNFSEPNRRKVELLIDRWRNLPKTNVYQGDAEIMFQKKRKTLFRACPSYKKGQYLDITKYVSEDIRSRLSLNDHFCLNSKGLKEETSISLDSISTNDIDKFVSIIYESL